MVPDTFGALGAAGRQAGWSIHLSQRGPARSRLDDVSNIIETPEEGKDDAADDSVHREGRKAAIAHLKSHTTLPSI